MRFMNEFDRTGAIYRFTRAGKPNRLGAALVLDQLATWADNNSDGFAYWPKPARAADKLMQLVESRTYAENQHQEEVDATDAELAAALRPVKAFLTRQKVSPEDRELILRSGQTIVDSL